MYTLLSLSLRWKYRRYDHFSMPNFFPPTLYNVSGNACYYSVQNILSSSLLSKNLKMNTH